ncbi:MAG: hypothetical protein K2X47_05010 [Bdellovibrionales bacterium]|nr:hypothetical protein [Bdellovibrionales bacterium]
MENLVPPSLIFIRDLKSALEDGKSIKQGMESFLARGLECHFRFQLVQWWTFQFQKSTVAPNWTLQTLAPHLELLLELLERGLRGDSIGGPLARLEEEVLRLAQDEIQKEIDLMPFRLMLPALLFFFPGLMCLLIGPILSEVLELLGG